MAEFEFAGMTFKGGRMFAVLTALSTAGGAMWGGFEFYKDYMDMKEIIQNIDTDAIAARNDIIETKLDAAIENSNTIKTELRDDIINLENKFFTTEDVVREVRSSVNTRLDEFEERLRLELKDSTTTMADLRDKINTAMDAAEARIKETQMGIDGTLEGVRNEMNQLQKDVTNSIREVEATVRESEKDVRDTLKSTQTELETDMDKLESDVKETIQEALNNPLAN